HIATVGGLRSRHIAVAGEACAAVANRQSLLARAELRRFRDARVDDERETDQTPHERLQEQPARQRKAAKSGRTTAASCGHCARGSADPHCACAYLRVAWALHEDGPCAPSACSLPSGARAGCWSEIPMRA